MSFDWFKYLELARELNKFNDEEHLRSAISRGYYGVFNLIRWRLQLEPVMNRDNAHEDVYLKLKNQNKGKTSTTHEDFAYIRLKRNQADYDHDISDLRDETDKVFVIIDMLVKEMNLEQN